MSLTNFLLLLRFSRSLSRFRFFLCRSSLATTLTVIGYCFSIILFVTVFDFIDSVPTNIITFVFCFEIFISYFFAINSKLNTNFRRFVSFVIKTVWLSASRIVFSASPLCGFISSEFGFFSNHSVIVFSNSFLDI